VICATLPGEGWVASPGLTQRTQLNTEQTFLSIGDRCARLRNGDAVED
jgi:hypothetical protein